MLPLWLACQVEPEPRQVMVSHSHLRIALPNGPSGSDNFVMGLAMDRSVDTVRPSSSLPTPCPTPPALFTNYSVSEQGST